MHDDPPLRGPGDTSSGIHRIVDPAPGAPPSQPATDTSSTGEGAGAPSPVEPVDGSPPVHIEASPSGDAVDFLDWAARAHKVQESIDPAAETLAEYIPAMPLTAIRSDRSADSVLSDSPVAVPGRRSLLVIGLISYASATTLMLLYLAFALSRGRPHVLESLPDVPPLDVQHGEVMKLAPADAVLPPGHRLALGESRRFGNIVVEPLRVVVEPVAFQHFSGRTEVEKPPTEPVLKLWLRFTNVSEDQSISPLDADLLFRRAMLDSGARANQFVRRVADQKTDGPQVLMYDHPITSEWDLVDQQLGVRLAPGESLETYLPSGEDGAELTGPLVWRVHFRKGYSPLGSGVTTLFDVEFNAADEHPTGSKSASAG